MAPIPRRSTRGTARSSRRSSPRSSPGSSTQSLDIEDKRKKGANRDAQKRYRDRQKLKGQEDKERFTTLIARVEKLSDKLENFTINQAMPALEGHYNPLTGIENQHLMQQPLETDIMGFSQMLNDTYTAATLANTDPNFFPVFPNAQDQDPGLPTYKKADPSCFAKAMDLQSSLSRFPRYYTGDYSQHAGTNGQEPSFQSTNVPADDLLINKLHKEMITLSEILGCDCSAVKDPGLLSVLAIPVPQILEFYQGLYDFNTSDINSKIPQSLSNGGEEGPLPLPGPPESIHTNFLYAIPSSVPGMISQLPGEEIGIKMALLSSRLRFASQICGQLLEQVEGAEAEWLKRKVQPVQQKLENLVRIVDGSRSPPSHKSS